MYISSKNSGKIMGWAVESVLGLLYGATIAVGKKLDRKGLTHFFNGHYADAGIDNVKISKMVYDLKRSNYLDFDNSDSVVFTNKAKMKIIDKLTADLNITKKYHLISFDIPEAKRANRNRFRRVIKRMGFKQIQKSLWVNTRDVGELVEAAAIEYNVNQYVAYFISEKSNIDQFISKIITEQ
ncbi:MAG: CRISPR-associated endonuclease Cas2 [Patescibacteria group bacterium]